MATSNRIDRHCFTWIAVSYRAEKELSAAREKLEVRGTEQGQSEYLRGKIAALREILALPDEDSEHVSE